MPSEVEGGKGGHSGGRGELVPRDGAVDVGGAGQVVLTAVHHLLKQTGR